MRISRLIANPAEMMALDGFSQGTQDYPDRSTTLILQVSDLVSGAPLLLEGPGIETSATIAPAQMPRHFVEQWKQNSQRFPRGVDIILAAARRHRLPAAHDAHQDDGGVRCMSR